MRQPNPAWRSPLHTIRDSISFAGNAVLQPVRRAAFGVIDALQSHPPAVQMESLFLTAVAMSQTLNLDPHEMVARAKRQLPDAEAAFTDKLQAVRMYAAGELAA